jgi:hypothetical protein
MQTQNNAKRLADALDEARMRLAAKGPVSPADVACSVMQGLALEDPDRWASIRDALILEFLTSAAHRRMTHEIKVEARADARQGVLALPEFNLVSPWVKVEDGSIVPLPKASIEQHQHSVKDKARKIKEMAYPRWSEGRMKAEKTALAQERNLDRKVIVATAGDKKAGMGPAMELFQSTIEKPARKQRRKAAKVATERRWPRT